MSLLGVLADKLVSFFEGHEFFKVAALAAYPNPSTTFSKHTFLRFITRQITVRLVLANPSPQYAKLGFTNVANADSIKEIKKFTDEDWNTVLNETTKIIDAKQNMKEVAFSLNDRGIFYRKRENLIKQFLILIMLFN